ncbi:hypothetical protein BH11PSE9_BH11PSE9_09360 [soil metagenome]
MTDILFFSLIFGGWTVLLLLLAWVLVFQPKVKPGPLWPAMLTLGLTTIPVSFFRLGGSWMALAISAMPFVGLWINRIAVSQWANKDPA